jgi:hypothetical protein
VIGSAVPTGRPGFCEDCLGVGGDVNFFRVFLTRPSSGRRRLDWILLLQWRRWGLLLRDFMAAAGEQSTGRKKREKDDP